MKVLFGHIVLILVTIIAFVVVGYWKTFVYASGIFAGVIAVEIAILFGNYWFKVRKRSGQ